MISNLQGSDQQQYTCQATNLVSTDTATVSLSVLGKWIRAPRICPLFFFLFFLKCCTRDLLVYQYLLMVVIDCSVTSCQHL